MEQLQPQTEINLHTLLSDPSNNRCEDCGGSPTKFVSLNNGIFLCEHCRIKHSDLQPNISNIKPLDENALSSEDFKLLSLSGNSRFEKFMNTYGVTSYPTKDKYNTLAAQYYREQVVLLCAGETRWKNNSKDRSIKCSKERQC